MNNKKKICILLILLFLATLLSGCDYDIVVIRYEFGTPPRIVYIAGVDTELDFSNATWFAISRDGYRDERPFPAQTFAGMSVNHFIDFDTPGIYQVDVSMRMWGENTPDYVITFFVQVIDEEIFNQLSGRETD